MDDSIIYVKTQRGIAEVATRGGALGQVARRVLIMIDGRRTVADLAPLMRIAEQATVIAQLESLGFVQRLNAPSAPASSPRTGRSAEGRTVFEDLADHSEERALITLDEARRRSVRELNERLGPDATTLSIRIEQCQTVEELRERLREAERLVAGFLGEAVAQDFVRALRRR